MRLQYNQPSDDLLLSSPFGAIGGAVCGTVIWSFAALTGNSGDTGAGIGTWDWGVIGLGIMYGGFFGILLGPLGYIIFLRNIGLKKAILPAAMGTIVGGCLGALKHIAAGLIYGCIGFFIALVVLRAIYYFKDRTAASSQI